jgi:autotransporter-associated beta strand protein
MKKNFYPFLKIKRTFVHGRLRLWGLASAWVLGSLSVCFGQISENFSNTTNWTAQTVSGSYTSGAGASGGAWTGTAVIVTPTAAASGTGSVGLVQLESINGILTLPNIASGGIASVSIQARVAGANGGFVLEKSINGGAWSTVQSFTTSLTTAANFSATVADVSANLQLRIRNSGGTGGRALFVHDVVASVPQNYYWNGGSISANPAAGGTGTWTTANAWRQGTSAGTQATWAEGNYAIFEGITGTVTIPSSRTASGYTFNTTGYTLLNATASTAYSLTGPVALGSNLLNIDFTGSGTLTFFGIISGSGGSITKNGSGTLALSGQNTYTGKTLINAGTVSANVQNRFGGEPASFVADQITLNGGTILSSGAALSFGSTNRGITLGASGGTFNAASGHTITLTTVTTGSGALKKDGVGTLTMTGAHTYTGLTTVNAGTLNLNRTGGGTLPATNNVTVASGATLVVSTDQTLNNLTVAAGGTVTVNSGVTLTINGTYSVSSNTSGNAGTIQVNGTLQVEQGGWPGNTGTFSYGASGTLVFANTSGLYGIGSGDTWWPVLNGPANVTVQGGGGISLNGISRTVPSSGTTGTFLLVTGANAVQGNALTLNGTVQINGGSFQSSPIYGNASLLKYNVNATYDRGNEWVATGVGTIGTTAGYPNNVQLSNNTTLNFPNGSNDARACNGNLTIDAGSSLYADYSGGSVNLTVGGSLNIAGNMSLGSNTGGDLTVKGNFTRTGTFTPNGRAVYFNGASGDQTITGATTFDYVFVDKAAGNVVLANTITCNQTLTLTAGKISTGSNKVIISGSGSVSRTSGWVIGNLQKNIGTGSNVARTYEIGDATNYTPLSISFANVTTQGDITATVAATAHPNFSSFTLNQTKYAQRYWTLSNVNTAFTTYDATFTYVSGDLQGGALGSALNVGKYESSAWTYPTFSNSGSTTTATGLTSFGDFMLAEAGCVNPTAFTVTGGGGYCTGGTGVAIGLNNSETGVDYQLILSAANNGSPVSGTNSAISFGNRTTAGTYTVLGTRTVGGCSTTMTGNAVVTINANPTVTVSKVDDNCQVNAGSIMVTITGGVPNYSIAACGTTIAPQTAGTYIPVTGSPATVTSSGGSTTFTGLQGSATYQITVTDQNGCKGQL